MEEEKTAPKQNGRIFIKVSAWMYILLGIGFLVNPAGMAGGLGYSGLSTEALIEVMASYGGLWIGIGLVILRLYSNDRVQASLWIIFLTFAGFALGRTAGIVRFGGFYGLHCYWLAFELAYLVLTHRFIRKNHFELEKGN